MLKAKLVVVGGDRRRILTDAQVRRGAERHDLNVVGCSVAARAHRELVVVELDTTPDRLVPDDAVACAEHVAVAQPGVLEQPVVVAIHDEPAERRICRAVW